MPSLVASVDGLIHEQTQVNADSSVDLTVGEIYGISGRGRIDFGGGELEPAGYEPLDRVWRNPDDEYQWWGLDAGTYALEYNEDLDAADPVWLQPRDALVARGATHPTLQLTSLTRVPVTVGGAGLWVKENARVSTLVTA